MSLEKTEKKGAQHDLREHTSFALAREYARMPVVTQTLHRQELKFDESSIYESQDAGMIHGADGIVTLFADTDFTASSPHLKLTDAPTSISARAAHWQLHKDEELYHRENYGPLGARDLRPNTDRSPGSGSMPNTFFVVALDAERKPLEILKYDDPGTGLRYQGQYQFFYETLADGSNKQRVTIKNWVDSEQNKLRTTGPKLYVGSRLNTLAGVSQYYYDTAGRCDEAQYFPGYTFLNRDRTQWKPTVDMKIIDGKADGTAAERWTASKIDFFDLLGPRLGRLR